MLENEKPEESKVNPETNAVETPETGNNEDVWTQLMGASNPFINPIVEESSEEAVANVQPTVANPQNTDEARQAELEEKSRSYWQSQADKKQNRIAELEAQVAQAGNAQQLPPRNPNTGQFVPQNPNYQEPVVQTPETQGFPEAPAQPEMPIGFSRVDAQSDDRSESARYLNDVSKWQADMTMYNSQKIDYVEANRKLESQQTRAEQERQNYARQAYAAQQNEMSNLKKTLKEGYMLDDTQVTDFVNQMSSKDSISVDNLVRLYAMNQGIQLPALQQKQTPAMKPSSSFMQQQSTQQVPNAMGVLPAIGNGAAKSDIDRLTDEMVDMSTSNSDWL